MYRRDPPIPESTGRQPFHLPLLGPRNSTRSLRTFPPPFHSRSNAGDPQANSIARPGLLRSGRPVIKFGAKHLVRNSLLILKAHCVQGETCCKRRKLQSGKCVCCGPAVWHSGARLYCLFVAFSQIPLYSTDEIRMSSFYARASLDAAAKRANLDGKHRSNTAGLADDSGPSPTTH